MSDTLESLRRKISGAGDLGSVVRTMKVLAASNIIQYENAVKALQEYDKTIQLGLSVCFRYIPGQFKFENLYRTVKNINVAVVFGSDQGLVGQFNDVITEYTAGYLKNLTGETIIYAVGERVQTRLEDAGLQVKTLYTVPNSTNTITPLVNKVLIDNENLIVKNELSQFLIFHNRPIGNSLYEPCKLKLLPLDDEWEKYFKNIPWPTHKLAETLNNPEITLMALIRNYLFVSLFKACAESMAGENASRLAAMQRAEKNIDEMLEELTRMYHLLRQSSIDEELFDVISGSESI
jgi:F-type H+-transporting ATPase subunit gamma